MIKKFCPEQAAQHKNILRDRYLSGFRQPGRFRAELEKWKKLLKGKGHE